MSDIQSTLNHNKSIEKRCCGIQTGLTEIELTETININSVEIEIFTRTPEKMKTERVSNLTELLKLFKSSGLLQDMVEEILKRNFSPSLYLLNCLPVRRILLQQNTTITLTTFKYLI